MVLYFKFILLIGIAWMVTASCSKLVRIDPPTTTITTPEALVDSSNATSALLGIYSAMAAGNFNFMNGGLSVYLGEYADELVPFYSQSELFYSNSLISNPHYDESNYLWAPAFTYIYQANAVIGGLPASAGISASAKLLFTDEAKFLRALDYFYLCNLYGDVPYLTSIDYHANAVAVRTPKAKIFEQIINDLKEAQANLPADYSLSGGDRVRANSWAATALLARAYLYTGDWADAETQASSIIGNTALFSLDSNLNNVFLKNVSGNNEAILQWFLDPLSGGFNVTPQGGIFIPGNPPQNQPSYYLSNELLGAFEPGDRRRTAWVGSTLYYASSSDSIEYYYPYKYKIGQVNAGPSAPATEYTTVLRLAEQYLIRAEARAQLNTNLAGAILDLNAIRERAGLPDLQPTLDQQQVLVAVAQERRIELFAEWGHRWIDLLRIGQANAVMSAVTPLKGQGTVWQSYKQLFPIPLQELESDHNLTQNPGY